MRDAGLRPSVGADAVCVASGDIFDEMRIGLFAQRIVGMQARVPDGVVNDFSQLGMTTREALETATINAAHACWMEDEIGSLTPGKLADVILVNARDLNVAPMTNVIPTVVGCAHGANVETVLVGGEIVKRDGQLQGIDPRQIERELSAARDRIFAAAGPGGIAPE
jgi:cytosine/adenosine deaminase-related metal-dependent hydrolase